MNKLHEYRTKYHLSLSDLGELLGVHYHTVYSWETEKSHPKTFQVMRMAWLFECTPDDLGFVTSDGRKPKRTAETAVHPDAQALYMDFMELSLDAQRHIAAYLSPDQFRTTVKRLRDGRITDDNAALIRRMIAQEREDT